MTRADLHNIATVGDLEWLRGQIFQHMEELIHNASIKEFYTPNEFAEVTGLKYSTIMNYCHTGKLEATQIADKGSWIIPRSEVDRLIQQSKDNLSAA